MCVSALFTSWYCVLYSRVCRYGEVVSMRMLRERRCAFINYAKAESAAEALEGLQVQNCKHELVSLSLTLSLSRSPPSLSLTKLHTRTHTQGKNLEGCYLLLRYPENPMLASSSSTASGSSAKKHGPVNGNECYYWRTSGCVFGAKCRFRHIPGNKGIDSKDH